MDLDVWRIFSRLQRSDKRRARRARRAARMGKLFWGRVKIGFGERFNEFALGPESGGPETLLAKKMYMKFSSFFSIAMTMEEKTSFRNCKWRRKSRVCFWVVAAAVVAAAAAAVVVVNVVVCVVAAVVVVVVPAAAAAAFVVAC